MTLPVKLDHCVIHVSEWDRSNAFYAQVLGAELIRRGERGWAYRFGDVQLNLHGPGVIAEPIARIPVAPGNSDICFEWQGPIADAIAHLQRCGRRDRAWAGRAQRGERPRHQRLFPRPRRLAVGVHFVRRAIEMSDRVVMQYGR